jgi:hypothetical protein
MKKSNSKGNRNFNDVIVGYVDEYEELLAKKESNL